MSATTANSHRPDAETIATMIEDAHGVAVAAAGDVGLPLQDENVALFSSVNPDRQLDRRRRAPAALWSIVQKVKSEFL